MAYVLRKYNGVMEDYLFIEQVSEVEEKWTGKRLSKEEAEQKSGIKNVFAIDELRTILGRWLLNDSFENAYFDFERGSYNHPDTTQILFAKELKRQYPFLHVQNIYQQITALRLIKSEDEIANMRTAIEKTRLGIEALMKNAKPGLYEYQLEAYYDFVIKTEGVKRTSFHTIAAAGANATVLHYDKSNSLCHDGDLILFDLGVNGITIVRIFHVHSLLMGSLANVNVKFTKQF